MIQLQIHYKAQYGKAVYVSGNSKSLGEWNPNKAIRMQWKENDIWEVQLGYQEMEYKYFISEYDKVQSVEWEQGTNRKAYKHSIDIWNHRKVCFQCINPSNNDIYISLSLAHLGQFQRRIRMKKKNGVSHFTTMIDVSDEKVYYQYHVIGKNEFSSQVYKLQVQTEQSYYKNALLIQCDGLTRLKQMIFQLNDKICYGYVPSSQEDYQVLKKQNLKTIVEFCNSSDRTLCEQINENGFFHMIVNFYHFSQEQFAQRILNLIQVLISKYKTLYICNNSLSHLRKYLRTYEKLSKHCF